MPTQTFEITAPNGKTLEITGDRVPTESELKDIFAKAGVQAEPVSPESSLVGNIGLRPRGGYSTSDAPQSDQPVRDMLSSLAHPQELKDFLALILPSEAPGVAGLAKDATDAYISSATRMYQKNKSLKTLPIDMLRDLYYSAFGRTPPEGAALVKSPTNQLVEAVNAVRTMDTANDAPEVVGGAAKAIRKGVNVEPRSMPNGMQATLPDKWGMTAVQSPELAMRAPNSSFVSEAQQTLDSAVQAMKESVAKGMSPRAAATALAGKGNPKRYVELINAYNKAIQ